MTFLVEKMKFKELLLTRNLCGAFDLLPYGRCGKKGVCKLLDTCQSCLILA